MPVADHPLHESTRLVAGAKYGCWNKPRKRGYWVKDGWRLMGVTRRFYSWIVDVVNGIRKIVTRSHALAEFVQVARFHVDPLTKHCCYDQRANDPRCQGCTK